MRRLARELYPTGPLCLGIVAGYLAAQGTAAGLVLALGLVLWGIVWRYGEGEG